MNLEDIPDEILLKILKYSYNNNYTRDDPMYDFRNVYCLSRVSKRWYKIIKNMSFNVVIYSSHSDKYIHNVFDKINIKFIEIYIYNKFSTDIMTYINNKLENIKYVKLGFINDLEEEEIKETLHLLNNIDILSFYAYNTFDLIYPISDIFSSNNRVKILDIFESNISQLQLVKLFEKFPKLVHLFIEGCYYINKNLFSIADEYLKKLKTLAITVDEDLDYYYRIFTSKDPDTIIKKYPNIEKLYVGGELYQK